MMALAISRGLVHLGVFMEAATWHMKADLSTVCNVMGSLKQDINTWVAHPLADTLWISGGYFSELSSHQHHCSISVNGWRMSLKV